MATVVFMIGAGGSFPISRDPPEGGTFSSNSRVGSAMYGFQFLGIPPKGEHQTRTNPGMCG